MPMYTLHCTKCNSVHEQKLSFDDYELVRKGEATMECGSCGGTEELVFNPGTVNLGMKEGPSGGWTTKSLKENKYRARHAEDMSRRERDNVFKSKLIPNYQGQEAGTWSDVQDHVRSKVGHAAASTYNTLVKQEKGK